MFKYFGFTSFVIVVVALASVDIGLADPIDYTMCSSDETFNLTNLDIEGCSKKSPVCTINPGITLRVKFSGCYNGSVTNISSIPFDIKGRVSNSDIPTFTIAKGDVCKKIPTDSPSQCPLTIPHPGGACGSWHLNVTVPRIHLGVVAKLGLPGTVQAKAWANNKTTAAVVCVQFDVHYALRLGPPNLQL